MPEKLHFKIEDLIRGPVMTTTPGQTVGHVRKVMRERHVSCMPVTDPDGQPVGIVTTTDLLENGSDAAAVSSVMARKVQTIPLYADVSLAARTMRKHHIHHLVVVHEKRVVGVLSSFDLLKVVEDKHATKKASRTVKKPRRLPGGRRVVDFNG